MWDREDIGFMQRALDLAEKGRGKVSPNPMVGAVIVKGGKIIAEGYHRYYGGLHAEREALSSCSESPCGATMYVTLEPCCHYGKQPPCTDAITESGIKRVVIGMKDPNPLVAGKGISLLLEHGIHAETGLLEKEAMILNRMFIKHITTGIPWVTIKTAMSVDGKIATKIGDSRWISSEESRHYVHLLRSAHAGLLTGIGTVRADDPMLNCRIDGMQSPVRIIADSEASISHDSNIIKTAGKFRTIIAHTPAAPHKRIEALQKAGIETIECPATNRQVDLGHLCARLGEMGIGSVLVEAGPMLNWSVVKSGIADEFYTFVAPVIIGGSGAVTPVGGDGCRLVSQAIRLAVESVRPSGQDILIHAYSKQYGNVYGNN